VDIYSNYVRVGERMNQLEVDSPIIIGAPDATVSGIIPSLTLKFDPLVFRVQGGGEQTRVWKSLTADEISPEERLTRLRVAKIEYLLIRGEPAWLPEFKEKHSEDFILLFKDQRLSLYRLMP
jgi:hypothetical protein